MTDPAHRITLLTPVGADGLTHLNSLDGVDVGPVHAHAPLRRRRTTTPPPRSNSRWNGRRSERRSRQSASGGYEGIHPDDQGNLILAEDVGGTEVSVDPSDPSGTRGRQAAQLVHLPVRAEEPIGPDAGRKAPGAPGEDQRPRGQIPCRDRRGRLLPGRLKLHTLGTSWPAQWITIHDTATDGTAPFDANALAKAAGATPFERPENLQFRPGSGSARSSSRRPVTRTPTRATSPSSPSAGPGAACSRQHRPTARATSRSWPSATRCTRRSTTWRSPTVTRCSPPRTAGTDCTRS